MTQDEIMEMAKEAHIGFVFPASEKSLVRFAKLVAAKEREACAEVILDSQLGGIGVAVRAAYLIRARKEQA